MLRKGARIGVVAPSGIFDPARLEAGKALVRSWGFALVDSPNLSSRHHYLAGEKALRLADLRWALTAEDLDAVWFARGGFGTVHLLDDLPWGAMDGRPVIGFSDATALFVGMDRRGVSGAVHGPVLHSLADHCDQQTQLAMRQVLLSGKPVEFAARHLCGPVAQVRARVVGGNLSVIASMAGTPWALQARDAILVLEDVGEAPYRVDRMLTQLQYSGVMDGVRAVALGEFLGCHPPEGTPWSLEDVLVELLEPLDVPIYTGLPVGHGPSNQAWVQGGQGILGAGALVIA